MKFWDVMHKVLTDPEVQQAFGFIVICIMLYLIAAAIFSVPVWAQEGGVFIPVKSGTLYWDLGVSPDNASLIKELGKYNNLSITATFDRNKSRKGNGTQSNLIDSRDYA